MPLKCYTDRTTLADARSWPTKSASPLGQTPHQKQPYFACQDPDRPWADILAKPQNFVERWRLPLACIAVAAHARPDYTFENRIGCWTGPSRIHVVQRITVQAWGGCQRHLCQ